MINLRAKTFAEKLYESIANENLRIYQDLFDNTEMSKVTEEYWKEALGFYKSLSEKDRVTFFKIIKQVEIDTISNVLVVLDGVVSIDGFKEDFDVTLRKTQEKINGDLQDLFLEFYEENK